MNIWPSFVALFFVCSIILTTVFAEPLCFDELASFSASPQTRPEVFQNYSRVSNPTYNKQRPAFVALPSTAQQIQASLKCAHKNGLRVSVKAGGHSFGGYSSVPAPGFMINMASMAKVEIDKEKQVAHVQAGARWKDVYVAFKASGGLWVVTGGLCPSVGVAGFSMGGGVGPVARLYGLAIDNLVSFTLITANGSSVVTASEEQEKDLFWALRGGGGGNFGVIVELTFRIHLGPSEYSWGTICYEPKPDVTEKALRVVGGFAHSLPRGLNIDAVISPDTTFTTSKNYINQHQKNLKSLTMKGRRRSKESKNSENEASLCLWVVNNGPKNETQRVMQPIISATSPSFVNFTSYDCFWEMITDYAVLHGYSEYSDEEFFSKNVLLPSLTPQVAEVLAKTTLTPNCDLHLLHFGGKISDIAVDHTPFPWRQTEYMTYASCGYSNPTEKKQSHQFLNDWVGRLDGHYQGSYLNFIDPYLSDWEQTYYGTNLDRLLSVKMKWNPPGSSPLAFPQEIGSSHITKPLEIIARNL